MTKGYAEFEFDLPEALLERLVRRFDEIDPAPLLQANVRDIPERQGVYQLLLGNDLAYIGKTDAAKGLRNRLERHAATIKHRKNLDPDNVKFRAIRVFVFTAMDLEAQLIEHYGRPMWQHSGFGSNDPGHRREDTELKEGGFDHKFPIDLDHQMDFDLPRSATAAEVLSALKAGLPYVFRFEPAAPRSRKPHPDLDQTSVTLSDDLQTTRQVTESLLRQLPTGWQATDMYSRLILYRETKDYRHGEVVARSPRT